jgi:hypothetical protein
VLVHDLIYSSTNADMLEKVAMLYVEKDLSGLSKAIFDQWDVKKDELKHKVLYCADTRVSPDDVIACIERGRLISCDAAIVWLTSRSLWKEVRFRESAHNRCT